MDVTRTDKAVFEIGESPLAAIEVKINGVTVLVDVRNKVATVSGHGHVRHETGSHDTLVLHVEPKRPMTFPMDGLGMLPRSFHRVQDLDRFIITDEHYPFRPELQDRHRF